MESKGCVIVESRIIDNLFEIIQEGHLKYVPLEWGLTVFLSKENKHLIKREMFQGRNVEIIVLPFDNFSVNDYNNLLTSQSFWNAIDYEKILLFQTDSRLLRNGIEEFINYQYCGAPWSWQSTGGNGGLSIRSKSMMLKVIENVEYDLSKHGNEDVYFSNHIESVGGKLASREECRKFSVEAVYAERTLGYHAIDKYLTKEQCDKIINQYNV